MGIFKSRNKDIEHRLHMHEWEYNDIKKEIKTLRIELQEQTAEINTLKALLKYNPGYQPNKNMVCMFDYQPQSITIKDTRIELRHEEAHDTIKYVTLKKEKAKC